MAAGMQRSKPDALAIAEAIESGDPTRFDGWGALDALSTHTELDGVDVVEESLRWEGNKFSADITVYVGLRYGKNDDEGFSTSDSFPGEIIGHLDSEGLVVIDSFTVDTSAFYE